MNFPDMTGGLIFLGIVLVVLGYGVIRALEWVISKTTIITVGVTSIVVFIMTKTGVSK